MFDEWIDWWAANTATHTEKFPDLETLLQLINAFLLLVQAKCNKCQELCRRRPNDLWRFKTPLVHRTLNKLVEIGFKVTSFQDLGAGARKALIGLNDPTKTFGGENLLEMGRQVSRLVSMIRVTGYVANVNTGTLSKEAKKRAHDKYVSKEASNHIGTYAGADADLENLNTSGGDKNRSRRRRVLQSTTLKEQNRASAVVASRVAQVVKQAHGAFAEVMSKVSSFCNPMQATPEQLKELGRVPCNNENHVWTALTYNWSVAIPRPIPIMQDFINSKYYYPLHATLLNPLSSAWKKPPCSLNMRPWAITTKQIAQNIKTIDWNSTKRMLVVSTNETRDSIKRLVAIMTRQQLKSNKT